jgi:rare lipoprotein A
VSTTAVAVARPSPVPTPPSGTAAEAPRAAPVPPVVMASYVPPAAASPSASGVRPVAAAPFPTMRPAPAPAGPRLYVQAGAFGTMANAERARVRVAGLGETAITPVSVNGQELYRVRVGPMTDGATAEAVRAEVQRVGLADARVVSD